jgi:hypothetical protein
MSTVKGLQIGDLVPAAKSLAGSGVVVQKNSDGSVVVDTHPQTVGDYHKYANTTGLSEEEKAEFNCILDEIYAAPSQAARIQGIEEEIERLSESPANKDIIRYLRNQQAYLLRRGRV